jgi:hypothetical protein
MSRPLVTADSKKNLDLFAGMLVPISLQVWDGGLGETQTACGLTSWYYLQLDADLPTSAYTMSAMATGGGGLLAALLVAIARRRENTSPSPEDSP